MNRVNWAAGMAISLACGGIWLSGCESRPLEPTAADIRRYQQMVRATESLTAGAPADEPSQVFGFGPPWAEPSTAETPKPNAAPQPPQTGWPQRQSTLTPDRPPYLRPADWFPR